MAIETLLQAVITATPAKRRELERVLRGETDKGGNGDKNETRLCTISGAARLLAIGRSTVYKLVKTGRLDTVELNGCVRITMRSIQEFINGARPSNEKTAELVQESKARYGEAKKRQAGEAGGADSSNDFPFV